MGCTSFECFNQMSLGICFRHFPVKLQILSGIQSSLSQLKCKKYFTESAVKHRMLGGLSHLHAVVLWDYTTVGFPPLVRFVWADVNAAVTLETQRFFSRTLQPGQTFLLACAYLQVLGLNLLPCRRHDSGLSLH